MKDGSSFRQQHRLLGSRERCQSEPCFTHSELKESLDAPFVESRLVSRLGTDSVSRRSHQGAVRRRRRKYEAIVPAQLRRALKQTEGLSSFEEDLILAELEANGTLNASITFADLDRAIRAVKAWRKAIRE